MIIDGHLMNYSINMQCTNKSLHKYNINNINSNPTGIYNYDKNIISNITKIEIMVVTIEECPYIISARTCI